MKTPLTLALATLTIMFGSVYAQTTPGPKYSPDRQKEVLGRGLVAYRTGSGSSVYICVSWRYLETDPVDIAFNVYRQSASGTTTKVASELTKSTFYRDRQSGTGEFTYSIKSVINGVESEALASYTVKSTANGGANPYIEIPMRQVADDTEWIYTVNDASFADLDGDGEMEIVIHRVGPNAKDNSQSGNTEAPVFQAYKLDGTFMWEINLGINIRDGAHYTQFMVYDLDGDGKAEVVMKTAEGGKDGVGNNIGEAYYPTYVSKHGVAAPYNVYRANANYRNSSGYILKGAEFLTVFNGQTGAEIVTTEYDPPRFSTTANYGAGNEKPKLEPTTSEINERWGDNYGNRVDRFIACVAYLDGIHPSVVMQRGYYTRTVLVAYDFDGTNLTKRWKFDTYAGASTSPYASYAGNGNHNVRVADVDGDGKDEIIVGSMTVDDDGKGLYNTKLGHGDAMHLTDFIPERPGLELFACHENKVDGITLRDAATGEIIRQFKEASDVGRCMGTDISSTNRGMEFWGGKVAGGVMSASTGQNVGSTGGTSSNMACWWDGDLLRELQDGIYVTKWNNGSAETLLTATGTVSGNGTKANPAIVGDILGDWREEVVLAASNHKSIRIYLTPTITDYRFHTFLQDPVYRMSIVYQNVAYNQPTHTGFYLGSDLDNIFVPAKIENISDEGYVLDPIFEASNYLWSDGSTGKTLTLTKENYADGKEHKIKLDMTYHGRVFSDSLTIKFENVYIPGNGETDVSSVEVAAPVKLLTTMAAYDLSVQFSEQGTYDCCIYGMNGNLVMKTVLIAGGKSVQTFPVTDIPAGTYIIVIGNKATTYRGKFIKL